MKKKFNLIIEELTTITAGVRRMDAADAVYFTLNGIDVLTVWASGEYVVTKSNLKRLGFTEPK
jgi:hypothetical protein